MVNCAARHITGLHKRTRIVTLMESCGWFTVVELARYFTALAMWNLVWRKAPRLVARKITIHQDMTLSTQTPRLQITRRGFRHRGVNQWNELSAEVRCQKKLSYLKRISRPGYCVAEKVTITPQSFPTHSMTPRTPSTRVS